MSSVKAIEPTHVKFTARFDILIDLANYLREILKQYKRYIAAGGCDRHEITKRKPRKPRVATRNRGMAVKKTPILQPAKFAEFWNLNEPLRSGDKNIQHFEDEVTGILSRANILRRRYFDGTSAVLYQYHKQNIKETSEFYHFLISENLLDQLNKIKIDLQSTIEEIEEDKYFVGFLSSEIGVNSRILTGLTAEVHSEDPFSDIHDAAFQNIGNNALAKMSFKETLQKFISLYDENRPDIPGLVIKNNNSCPQCKEALVLFSDDSEKRCDKCGYIELLPGTLFEDSQFYNQQITCTKHKKHNPTLHSAKWLHQILAKENKMIPSEAIDVINQRAIKEYTRTGVKRSMIDMKCRQVRIWLKNAGLAKLNNHAPLIRKIITGLNGEPVVPPQPTPEEELRMLNDFSQAIEVFERLIKKEEVLRLFNKLSIRNKVYYPFFWLKILMHILRGDPRLEGIIECIHLQSSATLTKDDLLWKMMCEEMDGYTYEPTDRTILIDIC
jgi:hypothetical protein